MTASGKSDLAFDQAFSCCRKKELGEEMFRCVCERNETRSDDEDVMESEGEVIANEFYESNTGVEVNLEDVFLYMCVEFQTQLSVLPTHFSVREFLEGVINDAHNDPYHESVVHQVKYQQQI